MNITELIEKHESKLGEAVLADTTQKGLTREFAIELLEMVRHRAGIHSNPGLKAFSVMEDLDKARGTQAMVH